MIDRRAFLQSSVALGTVLATLPASAASARTVAANASLVLVDRQLAGGAEFATAARARKLPVLEFTADVAGLWMNELEPRLRLGPVAIAGYTSPATLFCLDLLARDYGARTVERAGASIGAVRWLISSDPGRRASLAPAMVRARAREFHA
jgi:hypothetical protein